MKTVELVREVECRTGPEALWPLLADTERLNRLVGMAPVEIARVNGDASARWRVRTRLDGLPVEYDEEPFEWQAPARFVVRRNMRAGALHSLRMQLDLAPGRDGGSHVRWTLALTLKLGMLEPFTRLLGARRLAMIVEATRAYDRDLAALPTPANGVARDRLARATSALLAVLPAEEQGVARRLAGFVAEAPDEAVLRIRPYELAERWGEARERVLAVCLEAVVAGLLQMQWDIVCPSCRTGASRVSHLYELGQNGHCAYCDISFELPLDRAVEAVFQPAAAVRVVEARRFCTGGPAAVPHVVAQFGLPADGEAHVRAPTLPGRYRLFVRGGATADVTVHPAGEPDAGLVVAAGVTPAAVRVAPGTTIRVRQAGGPPRHAKLEHVDWADRAATAHHLSLEPRFRRLFSGEVLGPGQTLHVARVALLFSDLSASTALYSRVGDAPAFRLVQDHFTHLRDAIAAEGGVVVKTIGDAVMAAFPDEAAALRAAVAMQATWDTFRDGRPDAADTMLKVGVHAGPAYVVTANGVLDYFGQTVNVAARLQGAAHEREIVVTDDLARRAAEAGWLGPARVVERFDAVLKGLDHPLRAARLAVG